MGSNGVFLRGGCPFPYTNKTGNDRNEEIKGGPKEKVLGKGCPDSRSMHFNPPKLNQYIPMPAQRTFSYIWLLLHGIPSVTHLKCNCSFIIAQLESCSQGQPLKRTKSYRSEKTSYVYVSL